MQKPRETNQDSLQALEPNTENIQPPAKRMRQIESTDVVQQNKQPAIMPPPPDGPAPTFNPPLHALDTMNNNVLPLESALVPFEPQNEKNQEDQSVLTDAQPQFNFDLLEMLADVEEDQQLVMAATQYENQVESMKSTTKVVAKKTSPKKPELFSGCSISSIGTINIHTHKN